MEQYHQKFLKLLKYVLEDKKDLKVHRFILGLDCRIKIAVNMHKRQNLEKPYDLTHQVESNLRAKRSFIKL